MFIFVFITVLSYGQNVDLQYFKDNFSTNSNEVIIKVDSLIYGVDDITPVDKSYLLFYQAIAYHSLKEYSKALVRFNKIDDIENDEVLILNY